MFCFMVWVVDGFWGVDDLFLVLFLEELEEDGG